MVQGILARFNVIAFASFFSSYGFLVSLAGIVMTRTAAFEGDR